MKLFIRIAGFLLSFVFLYGIGQVIGIVVMSGNLNPIMNAEPNLTGKEMFGIGICGLILTLFTAWLFLKFDKKSLGILGFKFNINQSLQGLVLGGIFVALFLLVLLFAGQISVEKNHFDLEEVTYLSIGLFCAAMIEEIVFRGYLMTIISKQLGDLKALVISSLIFAAFHLMNPNLGIIPIFEIFLAGVIIGYAYLKTKNIWFVTFLHFSWNLVQTLLGFNVSGNDFYSLQNFSKLNENLWTGGHFGFEGSILSVISMGLMFLILRFLKPKH